MASHKKTAPSPQKAWYGLCPACGRETVMVMAHIVGRPSGRKPMCTTCRDLYPTATKFVKR